MDTVLPDAGKELLSMGLSGIIIFFLIWYIGRLQAEQKAERDEHRLEVAALQKRIEELHDEHLADAKQFVEIAQGLRTQGQAFLAAIERKT